MITIKDIADKAGVSISSVSRYFNNKALLHADTCARIEKVVAEYNYTPNSVGRSLRMARSGKILILLPAISNPIYQKILSVISAECRNYGYTVLICTTNNDPYIEAHLLEMLDTHYADGAIFFSTTQSREELERLNKKYPIVQCCEYIEANVSGVTIDNEVATYQACKYLLDTGHRKIAMFSGMTDYGTTISRELGYQKALSEAKIRFLPQYLIRGQYGFGSGQLAARTLLENKTIPDACITISDAVAIGAMKEFAKYGIQAGRDISVIGFDNTTMASMYQPALSSVSQPREEMGETAVSLLFERMDSLKSPTKLIKLVHKLIIRDSVRMNLEV